MQMTLEADYAIRIVDCLAHNPGRMGAKSISDKACVTLRFSLKILRKLVANGIVRSYKGAQGGYELARPLNEISLNDILETIEGPFCINRCLSEEYECTRNENGSCPYRDHFASISKTVQEHLKHITLASIINDG